jgi:hypothetical protein
MEHTVQAPQSLQGHQRQLYAAKSDPNLGRWCDSQRIEKKQLSSRTEETVRHLAWALNIVWQMRNGKQTTTCRWWRTIKSAATAKYDNT